jgi:endoglucanase
MARIMLRLRSVLPTAIFITLLYTQGWCNPMVHAKGRDLVDGSGQTIRFRGVQLEGWLMWNGVMWGTGFHSETQLREALTELAGEKAFEEFRRGIYANFVTEHDIEMISDLGFNLVRVSLNHQSLEEDEALIYGHLDLLMKWCRKHRVYVMLVLHAAPGGQSGVFVCDPESPNLWASQDNQDRTVEIWRRLAARYANERIVMGYDLLNEPGPFWGHDLTRTYDRISSAIRAVDSNHLLILEGSHITTDFSMFKGPPEDDNVAYCFHSYDFLSHEIPTDAVKKLNKLARSHDVPIINSEFGAHTIDWTSRTIQLYDNENVAGWVYWPWKRVPQGYPNKTDQRWMHLAGISAGDGWVKVMRWMALPAIFPKPTAAEAQKAMTGFVRESRAKNLVVEDGMKKVFTGR